MRGRLAGQLAFTAGEDRLLARALLRFGPDLERARLYLLPACARARTRARATTASRRGRRLGRAPGPGQEPGRRARRRGAALG
jgi:hypothetical protein